MKKPVIVSYCRRTEKEDFILIESLGYLYFGRNCIDCEFLRDCNPSVNIEVKNALVLIKEESI